MIVPTRVSIDERLNVCGGARCLFGLAVGNDDTGVNDLVDVDGKRYNLNEDDMTGCTSEMNNDNSRLVLIVDGLSNVIAITFGSKLSLNWHSTSVVSGVKFAMSAGSPCLCDIESTTGVSLVSGACRDTDLENDIIAMAMLLELG